MSDASSTTFTVRVESAVKRRLEQLSKHTGRSRSFLTAEALREYLDINEWQTVGIKKAMESLDRRRGISHKQVKAWIRSWGRKRQRAATRESRP